MTKLNWGVWKFGGAGLAILALLFTVANAAEVMTEKPAPPAPQEEELPPPPLEKPPELPKPPTITPYIATTTFEAGPSTGVLGPYGHSGAQDTLGRGWQFHKLGPVLVNPYLEYGGLFRTNIFQTSSNKQSDYVNLINPGIRFDLPVAGVNKVSLGYLGNYYLYSKFTNISHYDQNLNADAALNFPRWDLHIGNALRLATEEPTAENDRQRPYTRETPSLQLGYKLADRWKIDGNYQFDELAFAHTGDQGDNYQYHTWGTTLYYKFLPKTAALLQYIFLYREHPFFHIRDNVSQTPLAGLTWDPTSKVSGTIKFGYTTADYVQHIPDRNNSPHSWALNIQTIYRYNKYTTLTLVAQRSIQEDPDVDNNTYINSGLLLILNHSWHYFKVESYVSFGYYNNRYLLTEFDSGDGQFKKRLDNVTTTGVGLSRPITKWLRLRLDYSYYNRGSNFTDFSFNEHKIIFGLQTSF